MSKTKRKSKDSVFSRFKRVIKYLLIAICLVCVCFIGYPIGVILYGLYGLVIPVHMLKVKRDDCSQVVRAKIVDFEEKTHYGGNISQKRYYAVYEYNFDNKLYRTTSSMHYKGKREVGVEVDLGVSGFNPVEIYELAIESQRFFDLRLKGVSWIILGLVLAYSLYFVNGFYQLIFNPIINGGM